MIIEILKGVTLLLALGVLHKYVLRATCENILLSNICCGLLFGVMCLFAMSVPLEVMPGVLIDSRSVILSMAVPFAGVVGGLIAGIIAATYRIWIGGSGLYAGVSVVIMCIIAGYIFRHLVNKNWVKISPASLLVFALLVHLLVTLNFTLLPTEVVDYLMSPAALPLFLTFTPGVLLLGLILQDNKNTIVMAHDLRRHTEQALKARDDLVQTLLIMNHKQALIDEHAIFSETDQEGRIKSVNDLFCEISGFSRDELIGQDHRILNSSFHPKIFFTDMWSVISSGKVWHGDIKNRRKDGSEYWVKSTILPAKNKHGEITGYASIRTDITEDRQRQIQAEDARNSAIEANLAKSNFIATMSHELRTPLNAIIGFADMMQQEAYGPISNDKYRDYVEDIYNSGMSLKMMVEDILDITKLDLKTYEFATEEYDVIAFSEELARRFTPQLQAKDITIDVTKSPEFPRTLYGDKKVHLHVFNNLISNAIKFTPKGGKIVIEWGLNADGKVTCSVKDTGAGMNAETLAKLGEPFLSTDNPLKSKDENEGVGLGFYITKSLIEARGGKILVDSALGQGTTVNLIYPIEALASQSPPS